VLRRKQYKAKQAARLIQQLLSEPDYLARAGAAAAKVAAENGAVAACDALEAMPKQR